MALYFKHCTYPDPERWGALGLPSGQGSAGIRKVFTETGRVLLALPMRPKAAASGSIFAVCTIDPIVRPSAEVMNPDITVRSTDRWRACVLIENFWKVRPRAYSDFADGELVECAESARGKLFRVSESAEREISQWLVGQKLWPAPVYRRLGIFADAVAAAGEKTEAR